MNVDWNWIERSVISKKADLEKAKEVNKERDKLSADLQETEELFDSLSAYCDLLQLLESRAIKENDEYRSRRLADLSEAVTEAVAQIFPNERVKAELTCDFNRKNKVYLRITDEYGHTIKPRMGCGQLMQYLISFASVSKIAESLGCNSLFVDEAFGVASEQNMGIVGDLIKSKVSDGMQIVLVSQNSALYTDVPRHAIKLKYDYDERKAVLEEQYDVETF